MSSICGPFPAFITGDLPRLVEATAALFCGLDGAERIIARRDPHCRGVVILGLDAPADQLRADFKAAAGQALVKGLPWDGHYLAMPPAPG